jgi:hypothetical protein
MNKTKKSPVSKPSKPSKPDTNGHTEQPLPPAPAPMLEITDQQHQEVIDLLKGRCLEVSFTIHELPKSRRITGKLADTIAQSVKGRKRGVRSSWSLFSSAHPAMKELNQAIGAVKALRDSWTLTKSAEVKKGEGGKATIEGGKRLIWDQDVDEFYQLIVAKAKEVDKCAQRVQEALDKTTYDEDGHPVPSIKEMDKEDAGDAWDESVYPKSVPDAVGVAKQRHRDGSLDLDENGEVKYLVNFDEYHVSEKLSGVLRARAVERLDKRMSETVETAFSYAIDDLNKRLETFMGELVNRVRIYPKGGHPFSGYCKIEAAEVVKTLDHDQDPAVPEGQVKLYLAYKVHEQVEGEKVQVTKRHWVGPIPVNEYATQVCPQSTGERKKLSPSVIDGIISEMQAFRDKKSKMLGAYGKAAEDSFADLFKSLTKYKNFHTSNYEAAQKLTSKLKADQGSKEELANKIADTIAALEDKVEVVKEVVARRSIKKSLIGKV